MSLYTTIIQQLNDLTNAFNKMNADARATQDLPDASLPLNDTDLIRVSQGNVSKKLLATAFGGSDTERMRWKNLWVNASYKKNDMVYAHPWLGVANKDTQAVFPPVEQPYQWALPLTPAWIAGSNVGDVYYGVEFTIQNILNSYDQFGLWTNGDPNIEYTIIVYEIISENNIGVLGSTFVGSFSTTGWYNVDFLNTVYKYKGQKIRIVVKAHSAETDVVTTDTWQYQVSEVSIVSGEITYVAGNLEVSHTSSTSTNHAAVLNGLNTNDTIRITETGDASRWIILTASGPAVNSGAKTVIPVIISGQGPNQLRDNKASTVVITDGGVPSLVAYDILPGYWNNAPYIPNVKGFVTTDPNLVGTIDGLPYNTNAYGIDLHFSIWSSSPDWDYIAVGEAAGSAAGSSSIVIVDDLTTQDSTAALSANQGYVLDQKISNIGSTTNHSEFQGLNNDDHTQYHNDARGDARYGTKLNDVMPGTNVTIDKTDPLRPVINAPTPTDTANLAKLNTADIQTFTGEVRATSTADYQEHQVATKGYLNSYYYALTETGTAGEALNYLDIIYQDSSSYQWKKADISNIAKLGRLALCLTTAIQGATISTTRSQTIDGGTWIKGGIIYLGSTLGSYTQTKPTSGHAVNIGVATDTNQIRLNLIDSTIVSADGIEVNGIKSKGYYEDTLIKTANYTTQNNQLEKESLLIFRPGNQPYTIGLNSIGLIANEFKQQVFNDSGEDITIVSTESIIGELIPLKHGYFAYWKFIGSGEWVIAIGGEAVQDVTVSKLDDLTDVVITNPTNGQALKFNGTIWQNATDETGGAGGVSSVNGDVGPDVVLDADDISDATTTKKFSTAAEKQKLLQLTLSGTLNVTSNATLSGTNTGDETASTIKTKLGITTLSGSNTGDQDLSLYALKSTAVTIADAQTITGLKSIQNVLQFKSPTGVIKGYFYAVDDATMEFRSVNGAKFLLVGGNSMELSSSGSIYIAKTIAEIDAGAANHIVSKEWANSKDGVALNISGASSGLTANRTTPLGISATAGTQVVMSGTNYTINGAALKRQLDLGATISTSSTYSPSRGVTFREAYNLIIQANSTSPITITLARDNKAGGSGLSEVRFVQQNTGQVTFQGDTETTINASATYALPYRAVNRYSIVTAIWITETTILLTGDLVKV